MDMFKGPAGDKTTLAPRQILLPTILSAQLYVLLSHCADPSKRGPRLGLEAPLSLPHFPSGIAGLVTLYFCLSFLLSLLLPYLLSTYYVLGLLL